MAGSEVHQQLLSDVFGVPVAEFRAPMELFGLDPRRLHREIAENLLASRFAVAEFPHSWLSPAGGIP